MFPIALFSVSRIVSGIHLALGKYLFSQLIMICIFAKPFFDVLYYSCLAEQNCLSWNHVGEIYPSKLASLCVSRSNLILSYLNQDPLQWWQESSSLLSSKDWGFSGYHNKWPPIESNKLFLLHKHPSAFVPLPSINETLNNIFSWKHRILEFDLRQIIPCLIFSWIQVKMFNCKYN